MPRTQVEEFSHRSWAEPRAGLAWRSAMRRQRNVRAAMTFWTFNGLLVVGDFVDHAWPVLHRR
ncbi:MULTISPECIES: hypothetical protein [Actinoallomurus]|uniref:hypothetical protein n=1 Tax=Actinoallomurus TaxID=667113 RepID=UPI002E32BD2F|nr:hypothetical protein [Actinoallomurus sp. NBC_01490]